MALVTTSEAIHRLKRSALWALVVGTARFERGRRAIEATARLKSADLRLLWLLSAEGPRTMREIADALVLEQSTVNRQVNAALKEGLVERIDHASASGDEAVSRARAIRATDAGEAALARDLGAGMEIFGVALDALPAGERQQFMDNYLVFAEAYRVEAARVTRAPS